MDPFELEPLELEAGIPRPRPTKQVSLAPRSFFRAPLRVCRLLALVIMLPSLCLVIPVYLKFRVYSGQMYPMSMTDMRLIDSKISTTWCQRQVVKSNATFNAFVVPGPPELTDELVPVSMTRQLELEDDMKEYWGFYLLKGSTVTVSACVRWPGASLIMIKGYKHLQECAYIGDNSSEELDELLEANKLGLLSNTSLKEKILELKKVDGKANDPETMKRHKAGVSFHDPSHGTNVTSEDNMATVDVVDHDPHELKAILEHLHALRQAAKDELAKHYRPPSHLMSLPALHRHRDANVDRDERQWLSFKDIDGSSSIQNENPKININQNSSIISNPTNNTDINNSSVLISTNTLATNNKYTDENGTRSRINDSKQETENINTPKAVNEAIITKDARQKSTDKPFQTEFHTKTTNASKDAESNSLSEESSREVFEGVLTKLQALGDRGKRVLVKLHETMGVEYKEQPPTTKTSELKIMSAIAGSEEELDRLRKVLVEAIDEEKTRPERKQKRHEAREQARSKREMMLGQIDLQKELNEDDEARDYAAEEGLEPDGFAEHHEHINETTDIDMSNSEFWSSFSSSEEALLECEGLILNLPLTPHSSCTPEASNDEASTAARANALTYRVPANGYYFFVFNSENEVQVNFIKARFDLQKTRYDVAKTTLRECRNSTERCDLNLDIFSSQKVVLEVPLRNNDSLWNEQFVIITECEPRTSIYLAFVIAVPLLIIVFGFQ